MEFKGERRQCAEPNEDLGPRQCECKVTGLAHKVKPETGCHDHAGILSETW